MDQQTTHWKWEKKGVNNKNYLKENWGSTSNMKQKLRKLRKNKLVDGAKIGIYVPLRSALEQHLYFLVVLGDSGAIHWLPVDYIPLMTEIGHCNPHEDKEVHACIKVICQIDICKERLGPQSLYYMTSVKTKTLWIGVHDELPHKWWRNCGRSG